MVLSSLGQKGPIFTLNQVKMPKILNFVSASHHYQKQGSVRGSQFLPQTAPSFGHTGNLHPALTEVGSIPEASQLGHLHCLGAGSKGELGP